VTATISPAAAPPAVTTRDPWRWLPAVAAYGFVAGALLATGTPVLDVGRYTAYAVLAILLPGTLVYRALRRQPHTLVEDLAFGAAVGLVLELAAWFVFVRAGLESWLWVWPAFVVAPFALVRPLRRHWWVRGYTVVPRGWAWSVTAVIAGFTLYLSESFLRRNPILPTTEGQAQYLDLPFQMSIAGAATHQAPPELPQVAGEPLHYHWFGFAHMGAASLVSGVDLPTVFLRLAVPALCALAIVLVAVVGWRISGRAYAGVGAAVLMFTIGEFGYENGIRQLFGTQATFIVWGSPSMTYSWVLLLPLIAVLADVVRSRSERGTWVLAVLFLAGSTGAKASSVPVVAGALGLTGLVLLITRRRIVWPIAAALGLAIVAQVFATAVLFAFESHGVTVKPLSGLEPYVGPAWSWPLVVLAFLLNMQLRLAGIFALGRRLFTDPEKVFLLSGAVVGPVTYLVLAHPGSSNQYFVRAGFAFGVILSAWGWAEVVGRWRWSLLAFAVGLGAVLTVIQLVWRAEFSPTPAYDPLLPLLFWALALTVVAALVTVAWRSPAFLLTGVLVAGAPGLVMDAAAAHRYPNGGAYAVTLLPASKVAAARWVYEHSDPDDVLATNAHCAELTQHVGCDARSFWLSAYAQRAVLVEGWTFAPRMVGQPLGPEAPFWDAALLAQNDAAFYSPTEEILDALRKRGVRWLVADSTDRPVSPLLSQLATVRYENGRITVYEL
jgi:hypothetical protein